MARSDRVKQLFVDYGAMLNVLRGRVALDLSDLPDDAYVEAVDHNFA